MATDCETFGCVACWPADADTAWSNLTAMKVEVDLLAESHFMVKLRGCRQCAQRFLTVFAETIDWDDGRDPQFWTVLPVTAAEAESLIAGEGSDAGANLGPRALQRRSLCHDAPKAGPARSYWSLGIVPRPHD